MSSPFLHLRELLKELDFRDTPLNLAADLCEHLKKYLGTRHELLEYWRQAIILLVKFDIFSLQRELADKFRHSPNPKCRYLTGNFLTGDVSEAWIDKANRKHYLDNDLIKFAYFSVAILQQLIQDEPGCLLGIMFVSTVKRLRILKSSELSTFTRETES
ncbi:hypothetical protein Ahy_A07g035089 isoform C [Arachis hypogaea]|uniref:Uncharacterized protein n=1 Tax=Arachis hypogaea TaxID=3818 RepID=A0A445CDE3_ARAHY|nr:hypothetical protein Ahy_A07g035089 isoform C [Arachis hypogaea]